MKKMFITAMFMAGAGLASAETTPTRLTTADESELSKFCVAAVADAAGLETVAQEFGISMFEIDSILCNGKPLASFVRMHKVEAETTSKPVAYALNEADDSMATKLCVAAVESKEEFESIKSAYFDDVANINTEILCNGTPLTQFAKMYQPKSIGLKGEVSYLLTEADDSMVTRLCLAAISSEEEFRQIREDYFADVRDVNSEILCNGMKLDRFVAKYRNSRLTASL
jgi:hypothetical protein